MQGHHLHVCLLVAPGWQNVVTRHVLGGMCTPLCQLTVSGGHLHTSHEVEPWRFCVNNISTPPSVPSGMYAFAFVAGIVGVPHAACTAVWDSRTSTPDRD
jgi:hypothetical protein